MSTTSEEQAEKVGIWIQLGSALILVGFTTYLKIRAMLSADGVSDAQMSAADAEYARRIAQAQAEQKG